MAGPTSSPEKSTRTSRRVACPSSALDGGPASKRIAGGAPGARPYTWVRNSWRISPRRVSRHVASLATRVPSAAMSGSGRGRSPTRDSS